MPLKKKATENKPEAKTLKKKSKDDINNITKDEGSSSIQIRLSDIGIVKMTPEQKDLQIQMRRVSNILETTIRKLVIALNLPYLLSGNACRLRNYLEEKEVEYVQKICHKYTQSREQSEEDPPTYIHHKFTGYISDVIEKISKDDRPSVPEIGRSARTVVSFDREMDDFSDPHMIRVMEILWKASGLREKLYECHKRTNNPLSDELVHAMQTLKELSDARFVVTAKQEKERDKNVAAAYKNLTAARRSIKDLKKNLDDQRRHLSEVIASKEAKIAGLRRDIEDIKTNFKDKMSQIIMESEKELLTQDVINNMELEELQEQLDNTEEQFESLIKANMKGETALKKKMEKVEVQLSSWVSKYDNDMTDRQKTLDEFTDQYKATTDEMAYLREKYKDQEEYYEELMVERHAYEDEVFEERMAVFLCNRSARRIQRAWHAYREYKAQKKADKKKGGGEKKTADDKKKKDDEQKPVDMSSALSNMDKSFGGDMFSELKGGDIKENVVVEL